MRLSYFIFNDVTICFCLCFGVPKSRKKLLLSWDAGLTSALSLFELKAPEYDIQGLLVSLPTSTERLVFSNISKTLIQQQAASLELPCYFLGCAGSNSLDALKSPGLLDLKKNLELDAIAFRDTQSTEERTLKESLLKNSGLKAIFPL